MEEDERRSISVALVRDLEAVNLDYPHGAPSMGSKGSPSHTATNAPYRRPEDAQNRNPQFATDERRTGDLAVSWTAAKAFGNGWSGRPSGRPVRSRCARFVLAASGRPACVPGGFYRPPTPLSTPGGRASPGDHGIANASTVTSTTRWASWSRMRSRCSSGAYTT